MDTVVICLFLVEKSEFPSRRHLSNRTYRSQNLLWKREDALGAYEPSPQPPSPCGSCRFCQWLQE